MTPADASGRDASGRSMDHHRFTNTINPLHTIQELIKSTDYHDATISCGDDDNVTTSRLVLAAASPVFKAIFSDGAMEDDIINIVFVGYAERTVKTFLSFISKGECCAQDEVSQRELKELVALLRLNVEGGGSEVKPEPNFEPEQSLSPFNYTGDPEGLPLHFLMEAEKEEGDEEDDDEEERKRKSSESTNDGPALKRSKKIHERYSYQCDHCGKKITGKWTLMQHMKIHLGDEAFRCKVCSLLISDCRDLEDHQTLHEDTEIEMYNVNRVEHQNNSHAKFTCKHCDEMVRGEWPFVVHMMTHIGDKARECPTCKETIVSSAQWYKHKSWHNSNGEVCDICGKVMRTINDLLDHKERMHSKKYFSFECEVCGKRLATKGSLKTHITEVHGTSRNFVCDICGFASKSKQSSNTHRMIHLAERPYKCEFCEKSFLKRNQLDDHMAAVHLKLRNFECPQCGKRFSTDKTMKAHVQNVHEVKDSIGCAGCTFTTKCQTVFLRHVVAKHSELLPFVCTECSACFRHQETARRHFRANHPDKKIEIKFQNSVALSELKSRLFRKIS